jgi:hypothetical protein
MNSKLVGYDADLANLPPLTEQRKAELAALAARLDSETDYSDISPLTEQFWNNAVRGRFYRLSGTDARRH